VAEKEGAVERKVQVSQITRLGNTWPRAPISLFARSFHGIDSLGTRSNTLLRVDLERRFDQCLGILRWIRPVTGMGSPRINGENRRKRRSARFAVPCLSEVLRVDAAPSPTSPWDNSGVQPAPSQMDLDAAVGEESKYYLVFGPVVDPDARF